MIWDVRQVIMKRGPHVYFASGMAILTLIVDQASKWWVLNGLKLATSVRIEITGFLDFLLVWNQGVSYGLFPQQSAAGRWLLVLFSLAIVLFLIVWIMRTPSRFVAVSLGLIVGGALGNAIDRAVFGAVADFISFHAGGFYWYVFNVADAAIVAGAAGLIYDSLFNSHKSAVNDR